MFPLENIYKLVVAILLLFLFWKKKTTFGIFQALVHALLDSTHIFKFTEQTDNVCPMLWGTLQSKDYGN